MTGLLIPISKISERKVGGNQKNPVYVKTVHGTGYKFGDKKQ